jgi:N-acetylmuramoyl-L-alanine amidase
MHARTRALTPLIIGVAVLLLAAGLGLAWALTGGTSSASAPIVPDAGLTQSSTSSLGGTASLGATVSTAGLDIEVPDVVGKSVQVAEALITAAGLTVQTRVSDVESAGAKVDAVLEQVPTAGVRVRGGSVVTLTYQPKNGVSSSGKTFTVVVDAGHQAKPDTHLEPNGPGSSVRKAKVSAGVTGVATGAQESVESLAIALRVRDALKASGVDVVMVRTADDVNIANSERARIGNRAHADLVVRVHQSFSADAASEGVTSFFPSGNSWVAPIEIPSRAAAQHLEDAVVRATGAKKHDIAGRSDLSGFNYSTVPTVMIECGYLSNRVEDAKLATPEYRTKLGDAIAAGVMDYLRTH